MRTKLLILLFVILCSCGRKKTDDSNDAGTLLKIDLLSEAGPAVTKLSEFASDIDYIPLQTTESSLMGNMRAKIVKVNNRIYIKNVNGLSSSGILCFDIDGRFLYKVENTGRGPGEYQFIGDFDVSSDNGFLVIKASSPSKLITYGITDTGFALQRSVSLGDPSPLRMAIVPESETVFLAIAPFQGNEQTLSLLVSPGGDTIYYKPNCYKYEMVRKMNYLASNEVLVYTIGNLVCFKEEFSDTVFYADAKDNSFKPRMILDAQGTLSTPAIRGGSESVGNNSTYIANIFETSRYVFYYYFTAGRTRYRVLFDRKTDKKYKLDIDNESNSKVQDDLCGGPGFNIDFISNYCSDDMLFSFVEAITLKNYVASEDFRNAKVKDQKKKDELRKLADSLKETDNPVLVAVTPKN